MPSKILDLLRLKRAEKELPKESAEVWARACSLQEAGHLKEAAAQYRSILALHPGHLGSLIALGSIDFRTGDFDSAIRLYSEAIKRNKNQALAYYKRANALNAIGNWDSALMDYDRAININSQHAHAFCNRGSVLERLQRWDEALESYDKALELDSKDSLAHFNRASVLKELKRPDDALTSYDLAIATRLDYSDAYINRGNILRELHRFDAAIESYEKALELVAAGPSFRLAHYGRALALVELARYEEALTSYDEAIRGNPTDHLAHINRGLVFKRLKRWEEALSAFQHALTINEGLAEGYFYCGQIFHELHRFENALSSFDKTIEVTPKNLSPYVVYVSRGFTLAALRRFNEALLSFERAIELKYDYIDAHRASGHVLQELHRYEDAIACYDVAIDLEPDGSKAFVTHCSKAFLLKDLKRLAEALATYDRAVELKSDDSEVYMNRGGVLQELGYHEDAIASFDRAILLKPDFVEAFQGRGFSLLNRGRHEMAIASFDQAIALKSDQKYLPGFRRYVQMQVCDWDDFSAYLEQLDKDLRDRKAVSAPFQVLALVDAPILHRRAAEIWVGMECPADDRLGTIPERSDSKRVRIGYFSADFRNHPVSLLTAELFEAHDRSKFEIFAFAFGPRVQDAVRTRLEGSFDKFIDVSEKSDWEVAQSARELGIDIAVDLGGFTEFARPKVFALRAAPIQMSYIGYLGTMGAPYMDYILADSTIIPLEEQQSYSENIIYLPSYQVNDSKRPAVKREMTRADLGLPTTGFVYSCFNANYKITPTTFGIWMRILARVDGSCLFLYAGNDTAEQNLHRQALRHGVAAERIVFGKYLPQADYLARFRAMDLFLDTLPYNAGTTASDALWAGLPVLTLAGRGFAGRVAASLLHAIEMPELVATTAAQYEDTAVCLAANPNLFLEIKRKLARNRLSSRLFDTPTFTRNLEAAYLQAHKRQRAGLPPENIVIMPGYA